MHPAKDWVTKTLKNIKGARGPNQEMMVDLNHKIAESLVRLNATFIRNNQPRFTDPEHGAAWCISLNLGSASPG